MTNNNPGRPKPIPAHIAQQLAAALRAIDQVGQLLAQQGMRWADLAALVSPSPTQPALPLGDESMVAPEREDDCAVRWIQPAALLDLIGEIERRAPPSLGVRSRKFLNGLRELAAEYDLVRLSQKQDNWLRGLSKDAGLVVADGAVS